MLATRLMFGLQNSTAFNEIDNDKAYVISGQWLRVSATQSYPGAVFIKGFIFFCLGQ